MNPLLSIAIPTHNRFAILQEQLRTMLPELRETGVEVHVADSSTDGVTEAGIVELQREYPGIHYRRSPAGLAYDGNCLQALGMPSTAYVWYLADALRVLPGGLRRVLRALEETPCDLAVVNDVNRPPVDLPAGLYRDPVRVLERLAWHLTLAGAAIYSREQLVDLEARYAKFVGSNFMHLGIILENLAGYRRGLLWIDEPWVVAHGGKRSGWITKVFEVWARDWSEFILALPETYPEASKRIAIREHSLRTGVLEWLELGRRRRERVFDLRKVRAHRRHLALASGVPVPAIALLAVAPRFLAMPIAQVGRALSWVAGRRRFTRGARTSRP